ncbi:hypothetical protein ACSX1A_13420 [Pontibacter sp. MBLB2868]|uniref:hypothetical protein n=1 Tax=Pontibacter sp. MBLB2868 TaxID=3451555 RepID=UPI003F74DCA8
MNRYLFWLLMALPWAAFVLSTYILKDTVYPWIFIVNILFLQVIVLNIRRKQVGLTFTESLKAIVPGIGYYEWRRLYFAKP